MTSNSFCLQISVVSLNISIFTIFIHDPHQADSKIQLENFPDILSTLTYSYLNHLSIKFPLILTIGRGAVDYATMETDYLKIQT